MGRQYRIKARLLIAAAAATLTLSLPVEAQIPSTSGSAPRSQQTAETVNLTMEQRHVIKELIVKEMKIAPPQDQAAAKLPTTVGEVVPSGIPLQPMPVEVAAKVPQVKAHSFLVKDEKVIIIDPKDNRVAALIE
jgi:hypothetical protein